MGLYVSQADLEGLLGEALLVRLSNTDSSATEVDAVAVATAIETAEAEVNGYVGARYSLPLSSPYPALVVRLSLRVARYYMYDKHPSALPDRIRQDYDLAREDLVRISRGTIDLGLTTSGTDVAESYQGRSAVRSGSESRRLTRDGFGGY